MAAVYEIEDPLLQAVMQEVANKNMKEFTSAPPTTVTEDYAQLLNLAADNAIQPENNIEFDSETEVANYGVEHGEYNMIYIIIFDSALKVSIGNCYSIICTFVVSS